MKFNFSKKNIIIAIIVIIIIALAITLPLVLVKSSNNSTLELQPTIDGPHTEVENIKYTHTDVDYSIGTRKYSFTWDKPKSPKSDKFLYTIRITNTKPESGNYENSDQYYEIHDTNLEVVLIWGSYNVRIKNLANGNISDNTFIPYNGTNLFIPEPPIPTIKS